MYSLKHFVCASIFKYFIYNNTVKYIVTTLFIYLLSFFIFNSLLLPETEDDLIRNAEIKRRLISELSLAVKEVLMYKQCQIINSKPYCSHVTPLVSLKLIYQQTASSVCTINMALTLFAGTDFKVACLCTHLNG